MEGLVTDAQISAADDKVYNFLKWKLGGPTPVAVTWVSHGFAHFDRAYVDEAAAVLLGYKIPREGDNSVSLSPELAELLYNAYPSVGLFLTAAALSPQLVTGALYFELIAGTLGLPNDDWFTNFVLDAGWSAAATIAQAQLSWPQAFDFPTPTIYWTLRSIRYGERAQRALAWQVASTIVAQQKHKP